MAMQLETPSRIWRRIEDNEGHDMPSLPSLPAFEDSEDEVHLSTSESDRSEDVDPDNSFPIHSTPAAQSSHTATSTIRPSSSTSSTARFAHSIASRGSRSASGSAAYSSVSAASSVKRSPTFQRQDNDISFDDISAIPSLPHGGPGHDSLGDSDLDMSELGSPRIGALQLQGHVQDDDQLSLTDALDSVSRASSPFAPEEVEPDTTQKKYYDYSVSLKSEPKPSPFGKMRNVSVRKHLPRADMRTPSLSRTTPSPSSSSSHSTPHSTRSFGLPRSRAASPLTALSVPLPPSNNTSPMQAPSPVASHSSAQEDQMSSDGAESSSEEQRHAHGPSISDTPPDISLPEPDLTQHDETQAQAQSASEASSQDEHEPTFSSEEAQTPTSRLSGIRSPAVLSTAFSSPTPSTAFTPTPAFQPRPRARFGNASPTPANNVPSTPAAFQMNAMEEEDPATPFARRKSFLMDVINSTARPRYANPTPHPHRIAQTPAMSVMDTPVPTSSKSGIGSGSAGSNESGESHSPVSDPAGPGRLHAAFAGLTPGPRPRVRGGRLSHPLARGWTASDSDEAVQSDAGSQSPYDGAGDRASFISTASSHDLTSHPRANASFDPLMGLGANGHGVGRFNAGKLNNYLHGLNRRLQEENESLNSTCVTLKRENGELREEVVMLREEVEEIRGEARRAGGRRSSGGRRVSDIGSALGGVKEDVGGEGWMEEKVAMEEELESLRAELEKCMQEKEDASRKLEEEQAERSRDRDKWRERMGEVEQGVEGIVRDLESRLDEAMTRAQAAEEIAAKFKEAEKLLAELEDEKNFATERAEKAEKMLENGKELGGELRETSDKLSKAMSDLRHAQAQINDYEEELGQADERINAIEHQLQDEREHSKKLQDELEDKERRLDAAERRISAQENALQDVEGELQAAKDYISELEQDGEAAVERIETMEEELTAAREKAQITSTEESQAHGDVTRLEEESERNAELARQMENALQAAEEQMQSDAQALSDLQSKFAALERAQERSRVEPSHDPRNVTAALDEAAEQIDALENELDDAHKEIGRLNGLLAQSPARKALEKARDSRIEMLEKERDELLERVKGLKTAMVGMSTPSKFGSPGGISPMHRQVLNMTMRTPKTPGGPLKDLSWLHPSMSDPSASPYYAEIQRLQQELDRANESIDEKLDRLEDAGFGVVELTQQLEDERARNVALEEDIARLGRREERRIRRLERARCLKCKSRVDLSGLNRAAVGDESSVDISSASLPSDPPTPPTRTSEALRQEVQSVNRQLTLMKKQWQEEKRQLLGDKAVLQDAANRLNLQVQDTEQRISQLQKAGEKARAGIQGDLDQANRVIADLEEDLKQERTHLRTLTTEQQRVEREKNEVLLQLRRAETDMDEVKKQLQRLKKDNNELEAELRETATAEQKARILEAKASANDDMIDQLRQERSLLAADHKALQKRFSEVSQHMRQLRDEHAASQHSHDSRRHELDLRLLEIEDLKRELAERTAALHAAQTEKQQGANSHEADQRALAALEADLARVRKNAEALGRDLRKEQQRRDRSEEERKKERESAREVKKELERIRREVEKVERGRKQAMAEVRVLRERVGALEGEKSAWEGHICAADQDGLVALREQHKRESKGLILQIGYLKAKYTRETNLRADLGQQKKYLLLLLARHERGDAKILAMIASIGFPVAPPEPPKARRKTLKTVAQAVMFFGRVQRLSEQWRKHGEQKAAITAALQEVRRRRVQGPADGLAAGQQQPQQRTRASSGRRS